MISNIPVTTVMFDSFIAALVPGITAFLSARQWPSEVKAGINIALCVVAALFRCYISESGSVNFLHDWGWSAIYILVVSEAMYARFKDTYQVLQDIGPISDDALAKADWYKKLVGQQAPAPIPPASKDGSDGL